MNKSSDYRKNSRYCRWLLVFAGIFAAIAVAASAFFAVNPVSFRKTVFQPVREARLFWKELTPLSHWREIEKTQVPEATIVSIPKEQAGDLKIVADLRMPRGVGRAPAFLLLHGSAPWGRKAGLIRLLGSRLQEEGWIVLAPDARGFGESDNPPDPSNANAWTVQNDVKRLINFLLANPRTDHERIFVFGHSFGGGQALAGALQLPEVKALILVGPTRYLSEIDEKIPHWTLSRMAADRGLNKPIPVEAAEQMKIETDISRYADGLLREEGHKPILLVDGEFESEAELKFLANVASKITPPFQYETLSATRHYCGVFNFFGSDIIYYRKDIWSSFFDLIIEYVDSLDEKILEKD
jgi:pimeloyl-ACP methyl ester carboxylesterase